MENFFKYFPKLTTYQRRRRIFANRGFVKKVCRNKVDFLTIEITPKIVRGNNGDFSTSEITSKKSTWKRRGFFDKQNYIENIRENVDKIPRDLVFDVST